VLDPELPALDFCLFFFGLETFPSRKYCFLKPLSLEHANLSCGFGEHERVFLSSRGFRLFADNLERTWDDRSFVSWTVRDRFYAGRPFSGLWRRRLHR